MRGNTTAFAVNMLLFDTFPQLIFVSCGKVVHPPPHSPFFAIQPIFESRRSERKRVDRGGLVFLGGGRGVTKKKTLKFTFHI